MKIYIVIPVYNRKAYTRQCLRSLQEQDTKTFQTIVVDDGSTDGTSEMIQSEFPEVTILHSDGSLWWTGATNLGITYALGICQADDAILLLNDDLVVPESYISTMMRLAHDKVPALIGSVVVDISDRETILSGGVKINWLTAKQHNLNADHKLSSFPNDFTVPVSTLTGRGVLIPTAVFRMIGLYDDHHFKQCGDTEFPRRAQKAGYQLKVNYAAVVYSYRGTSNNINLAERYFLSDLRQYLGSVRSNYNLKYRFWFAMNTRSNLLQATSYFLCDTTRIMIHFAKRCQLQSFDTKG